VRSSHGEKKTDDALPFRSIAMNALVREDFQKFDRGDPLACFREEFFIPPDVIYMDGNSLGAMPKAVVRRLGEVTERAPKSSVRMKGKSSQRIQQASTFSKRWVLR
jgi:kynureninase